MIKKSLEDHQKWFFNHLGNVLTLTKYKDSYANEIWVYSLNFIYKKPTRLLNIFLTIEDLLFGIWIVGRLFIIFLK